MPGLDLYKEADRQLTICNACRYCEGYCAVFRALELRRDFAEGDVVYLAHLCHDCRACYYACMYSPPHEFAINIPQIMSGVRLESYRQLSWPAFFARSFKKREIGVALAAVVAGLVVILTLLLVKPEVLFRSHHGPGAFYVVIPYLAMRIPALVLFFYGIAVWIAGGAQFWRDTGGDRRPRGGLAAAIEAAREAFALHYLKGGGPGCYYPEAQPSAVRRVYHSFVFWGFLFALTSTTLAAIYQEIFRWLPPYALTSAPVISGTAGGVAIIIGAAGLIWYKARSDSAPAVSALVSLDYIFLAILGLVSISGLLTLALRETWIMGTMLTIHLALIAALFITAPYGKFVHFVYRYLALVRHRAEENQPAGSSPTH